MLQNTTKILSIYSSSDQHGSLFRRNLRRKLIFIQKFNIHPTKHFHMPLSNVHTEKNKKSITKVQKLKISN